MSIQVSTSMRSNYCGQLNESDIGRRVKLAGWVAALREHGEHLAFIDLRDHTGIVQCVVDGLGDIHPEYVLSVAGVVRERPQGTENDDLPTGRVEVAVTELEVLSTADPLPMPIDRRSEVDEALRLKFRYLDLRKERMQANLRLRAKVNTALRRTMESHGFVEVETPLLWTPTPEGAREFAVPSRLQPGNFYVLPQSPQIAKQLLMVGGFDRYYQIARCLRDEDLRADRQFEFTQLDIEASFATQEEIHSVVSDAVLVATAEAVDLDVDYPIKISWTEAMDRYGTDKPDLRFDMPLVDLTSLFSSTTVNVLKEKETVKAICLPGGADWSRSRIDALVSRAVELGSKGLLWMKAVGSPEGMRLDSPVSKALSNSEMEGVIMLTKAQPGDLIAVIAGEYGSSCRILGQLRSELGKELFAPTGYRYVWVVDFPMFEGYDEEGNLVPAHHPFTMPNPEDLDKLDSDPLAVRSQSYDLVLNGWELGSGSIRIHRRDIQQRVFAALGISDQEAEARFGFLLQAFRYGAPPHGGFALGIDRFVAILAGEESIREVIAFPKTQSGADLMTGAPKPLSDRSLKELNISLLPPRKR
ncbi:MAG: aspartate--tRNA ligase [Actinobacteria bacterium]|jgi:aspartyl-tRNA synthetase|nr:aspartate--tRNA ligase [Actinomycetota bacterium]MCL6095925.1 aspartate--tRNA ligase [Actinomycetota bacterium]